MADRALITISGQLSDTLHFLWRKEGPVEQSNFQPQLSNKILRHQERKATYNMNVVGGASVVLAGCSGAAAHAPLCSDYTGHSSSGVALTLLTCHRYRSSVLLSDTVSWDYPPSCCCGKYNYWHQWWPQLPGDAGTVNMSHIMHVRWYVILLLTHRSAWCVIRAKHKYCYILISIKHTLCCDYINTMQQARIL